MVGIFILIVIATVVILIALLAVPEKDHKFHPGTASVQAIVMIIVVVVAAYWYFIERKGMAHANVELSATGVRLNDRFALIQARVEIENTGHVLLAPTEWDVRLLSVVPGRDQLTELAGLAALQDFRAWPRNINGSPGYYEHELTWQTLRQFRGRADQEIEPGERDIKTFDIVVSCDIRTAKLTVALRKPETQFGRQTPRPGGWWWRDRMLIGLSDICDGEIGVVRTLGSQALGSTTSSNAEGEGE